jgi:hypothetical protein
MENDLRRHLLTCAAAFEAATDRKTSTVARLATGDWRFFDRIGDGASFTARKYDEIMDWFAANWPAGLIWPSDVPRPALPTDPANDAQAVERAA